MKKMTYTKKEIKDFLIAELAEYETGIGCITEEERESLREWVTGGNSPYCNPWLHANENGFLMDYIQAFRIDVDMCNNPGDYFNIYETYPDVLYDDIPF